MAVPTPVFTLERTAVALRHTLLGLTLTSPREGSISGPWAVPVYLCSPESEFDRLKQHRDANRPYPLILLSLMSLLHDDRRTDGEPPDTWLDGEEQATVQVGKGPVNEVSGPTSRTLIRGMSVPYNMTYTIKTHARFQEDEDACWEHILTRINRYTALRVYDRYAGVDSPLPHPDAELLTTLDLYPSPQAMTAGRTFRAEDPNTMKVKALDVRIETVLDLPQEIETVATVLTRAIEIEKVSGGALLRCEPDEVLEVTSPGSP